MDNEIIDSSKCLQTLFNGFVNTVVKGNLTEQQMNIMKKTFFGGASCMMMLLMSSLEKMSQEDCKYLFLGIQKEIQDIGLTINIEVEAIKDEEMH